MSSSSPVSYPSTCDHDGCRMSVKPIHLRKHKFEHHSTPEVRFALTGVVVLIVRDYVEGDFKLRCPVPTCKSTYKARSSFKKHIDTQHENVHVVPVSASSTSTGTSKRPRGSSFSDPDEPSSNKRGKTESPPPPAPGPEFADEHVALRAPASAPVVPTGDVMPVPDGGASTQTQTAQPQPSSSHSQAQAEAQADESAVGGSSDSNQVNEVVLQGSVDYLLSVPVLDAVGFYLHKALRVLLCKHRDGACLPKDAVGHAKNSHGVTLKGSECEAFLKYCEDEQIHDRIGPGHPGSVGLNSAIRPSPNGPPVQLIKCEDGLACNVDPAGCSYCCCSKAHMENHIRAKHRLLSGQASAYHRPAKVQSLYSGIGRAYFQVKPELEGVPFHDPWHHIVQDYIPNLPPLSLAPPNTDRERTPFMKFMGWDQHLSDVLTDRSKLKLQAVLTLQQCPTAEEGHLSRLTAVVREYIRLGMKVCRSQTQSMGVQKILIHGRREAPSGSSGTPGKDYWAPLSDNESPDAYAALVDGFFRATLRCHNKHPSGYVIPLKEAQAALAKQLLQSLRLSDDRYRVEDALKLLHELSVSLLVSQPEGDDLTGWTCPVRCYLAVRGIKSDGNFIPPRQLTPELAKLKYFCRNCALIQAEWTKHTTEGGMLEATRVAYDQILELGQNTVFNMLTEMQAFVSSVAFKQVLPPKLFWSEDCREVSADGETLKLDSFRSGIQQMIRAIWDRYDSISGGRRFADNLPKTFKDDLCNDTRGYSFLSNGPFTKAPHGLLHHLVTGQKLASINSEGHLSWEIPAVRRFFRVCDEINELLAILTFILPSSSTRVTEFIDNKLRNASRRRGLYMLMEEMFLLSGYHKMTNATGLDACIPAFYPEQLQELTLEIFAGGLRDCETVLAPILFGRDSNAAELYHTYLWVQNGQRVTPDGFSPRFKTMMGKYCACAVKPRSYRQMAIGIAREHILPPYLTTSVEEDNVIDEAAHHGGQVAHTSYAVVEGDLPHLTVDSVWQHRTVSKEWHSIIGVGMHPPPIPIRRRAIDPPSAGRPGGGVTPQLLEEALGRISGQLWSRVEELQSTLTHEIRGILPALIEKIGAHHDHECASAMASTAVSKSSAEAAPGLGLVPLSSSGSSSRDSQLGRGDFEWTSDPVSTSQRTAITSPVAPAPTGNRILSSSLSSLPPSSFSTSTSSSRPSLPALADDTDIDYPFASVTETTPRPMGLGSEFSTPPFTSSPFSGHWGSEHTSDIMRSPQASPFDEGSSGLIPSASDEPAPFDSNSELESFELATKAREGLRILLDDPAAVEKSKEQLEYIVACMDMNYRHDIRVILPTGGGKSAGWLVPAMLDPQRASAIVTPYSLALEDQLRVAEANGIKAGRFTAASLKDDDGQRLHHDVQLIFVQPETVAHNAFRKLMTSAIGSRIKTIFVDEFHDLYAPHPDRRQIWMDACEAIAQTSKQLAFVSATHPPHLDKAFLEKVPSHPNFPIRVIRASTDRPELAHYILSLSHPSPMGATEGTGAMVLWTSTIGLVKRLTELLTPDERILVFFERREQVDDFSSAVGCARYHSKLPTTGNTSKAHNLGCWDCGDPPIMAATMAAGQGVDRPYVKFVLIHGSTFGMLPYAQQAGRAGRGGRPSYVILLRDPHACRQPRGVDKDDANCAAQFQSYAADGGTCRRKALLSVMDGDLQVEGGGESFAGSCLDRPRCNPCDVCDPESDMLKTVWAAFNATVTPTAGATPTTTGGGPGPSGGFNSLSLPSPSAVSPQASMSKPHLTAAPPLSHWPSKVAPIRANGGEGGTLGLSPRGRASEADFSGPRPIVDKASAEGKCIRKGAPVAPAPEVDDAIGDVTRSISQPVRSSRTSNFKLTQVPPPSGGVVCDPGNGIAAREKWVREGRIAREDKSNLLDWFLRTVEGYCPVHFVTSAGGLERHHGSINRINGGSLFHSCSLDGGGSRFPFKSYLEFKKQFTFKAYDYCYFCGSPQTQKGRGEAPSCHLRPGVGFGSQLCPWADFPFVVVFSIWRTEIFRKDMMAAFKLDETMSYDGFKLWCKEEDRNGGEYFKMLEVFMWFCRKTLLRLDS